MSNGNEQEDVWVHVGVPAVFESAGEEEDGVMVADDVVTEHCEQNRDNSPDTEHSKEEEITSISTDLLWFIFVCLMLASTLSSLFLSAPCTSTVGVPPRPVLTPTKSVSTVVHQTSQSTTVSSNALDFDDFMLAEHDAFFGVASVRTSHLKTAEVTPVVISSSVDAKKYVDVDADADNEAHTDGVAEATTSATEKNKGKAVTKRVTTSLQETTQGVGVDRRVDKKKPASHKKAHARERFVAGGTLQQARSVGSALSEHALVPTPAKTVKAGGAIPTNQSSSTGGGSKETKVAVVQAPITMEANTGYQVPAWQPTISNQSVTGGTKKQESAAGVGTSVGGAGQPPAAAFIKKTPPSFQVATRVLAGVQIPAAVDTSRDIPVVDKARMARTMTMQEAPVIAEPAVVVLTKENFRSFLSRNKFAFVVFHGPDCDDCDKLTTEWETFAQQTKTDQLAVSVGKVDCAQEKNLCDTSMTTTFPSFRWYQNAMPLYGYYRNYPRTSEKFLAYAKTKIYVATTTVKTL